MKCDQSYKMISRSSSSEIVNATTDGTVKNFNLDIKSDCTCIVMGAINQFKTCLSLIVSLLVIYIVLWSYKIMVLKIERINFMKK